MLLLKKKTLISTIKQYIPHASTIIEAGSFDGRDTERLAAAFPYATIHSFEPVNDIFTLLEKNTQHIPNVRRYPYALSNKTGSAPFFISEKPSRPGQPFQAGSLLQPQERLQWSHTRYTHTTIVPTITLYDWARRYAIPSIDLLWLDAQGHEQAIIQGTNPLLSSVKAIYTEVHFIHAYENQPLFEEMVQWLADQSFSLVGTDFTDRKKWFFGNALFIRT